MWEESWVNLMMKMKDMPYYHYDSNKEPEAKEGTIEDLKNHFSKYMQQ